MKTSKRPGVNDATVRKTVRVNVRIDSEAQKRLAVHCAMTGLSPGEIITRLCEGLREFSMPVNLVDRSAKSHRTIPVVYETDSATTEPFEVAA